LAVTIGALRPRAAGWNVEPGDGTGRFSGTRKAMAFAELDEIQYIDLKIC
jgi:hypothetical protein